MFTTKMLWKSLSTFVSLFVFVTPFEILFGCGKRESFDDSFLNSFKLPPLQNPHQRIFFFPLTFSDFVVFLCRTSKLKKSISELDPAFSHLQQSVKSVTFQTFLSKNDAIKLNSSYPCGTTYRNYPKPTQNQEIIEIYSKWWSQTNYLYPFCFKENLVLEKEEFASGGIASCYRIKKIIFNDNSLSIDSSKRMILKSVRSFPKRNASEVGLSKFVDLQELKFSLFYEFEKCPYIHPLTCLVVSNQNNNRTVPVGYLCEEAELGSLFEFAVSHKLFSNYSCFLRELFHVAEAIQFLHKHGIIHKDLHSGNILLFPDGNEVRMRLIDFGISTTVEYVLENEPLLKQVRNIYFESISEPILPKSFDERAVFREDWNDYAEFLAEVIENALIEEEADYEEIKKLIDLLKGDNYWKLKNVLQTIKEHFDKEIENCSIEEPFHYELQ